MRYTGAIPDNVLRGMPAEERARLGKRGVTLAEAQAKLATESERELQKQLTALLRIHGIKAMTPTFGRKTRINRGWPDMTFSALGVSVVWEVKLPGKNLEPDQEKTRDELTASPNCWRHYVIHSVAEGVDALLELKVIK